MSADHRETEERLGGAGSKSSAGTKTLVLLHKNKRTLQIYEIYINRAVMPKISRCCLLAATIKQ